MFHNCISHIPPVFPRMKLNSPSPWQMSNGKHFGGRHRQHEGWSPSERQAYAKRMLGCHSQRTQNVRQLRSQLGDFRDNLAVPGCHGIHACLQGSEYGGRLPLFQPQQETNSDKAVHSVDEG